jgi:predicted transcriptional regulator YheO
MMALKHFVDASLSVDSIPMEENFSNDVCEALNNIIKDTLSHYQIPVANLPKEEKLNIVSHLDEKGAFLVKGAVEQVAATLGVSRYSVYNYLDEVRSHRNGK